MIEDRLIVYGRDIEYYCLYAADSKITNKVSNNMYGKMYTVTVKHTKLRNSAWEEAKMSRD